MATRMKNMPRSVVRRILKRGAEGEKAVVVTFNAGKPSRVFRYREYEKRVALAKHVKPWQHRKPKARASDPLGAVDGTVLLPITRKNIYE